LVTDVSTLSDNFNAEIVTIHLLAPIGLNWARLCEQFLSYIIAQYICRVTIKNTPFNFRDLIDAMKPLALFYSAGNIVAVNGHSVIKCDQAKYLKTIDTAGGLGRIALVRW